MTKKLLIAALLCCLLALAAACGNSNKDQAADLPPVDDTATTATGTAAPADSGAGPFDASAYDTLAADAQELIDRIAATTPTGSRTEQRDQYRALEIEIDDLENALDRFEDDLEYAHRSGDVSDDDYRALDRKVETTDNDLDRAADDLEYLFGIDD